MSMSIKEETINRCKADLHQGKQMVFGKQIMKFFSRRASPPKGAKKAVEREAKNRYRGPNEKKPPRKTMQKITSTTKRKAAGKKKR